MAPINNGISHVHNHPGSKMTNIRDLNVHPSQQPYDAVSAIVCRSHGVPSSGNNTTNGDPSPPSATDVNSEPDDSSSGPIDKDDGGMSTLEKILSPPESDTDPQSKIQYVKVYHIHYHPNRTLGPFIPQPPSPSKEKPGSPDYRRDSFMDRLRRTLNTRSNNGTSNDNDDTANDGDDEDDNSVDGPDVDGPVTPILTSSTTAAHLDPPATPRRMTRSQIIHHDHDSPTPSPRTLAPPSKRKRKDSKTDLATPTRGQRISKRQRKSISESPLPPMPPIKRTRAEQKRFASKLDRLIFGPERPGSVEREVVEIKSGAKEWRKESLHDELWDGNSKSE